MLYIVNTKQKQFNMTELQITIKELQDLQNRRNAVRELAHAATESRNAEEYERCVIILATINDKINICIDNL